MKRIMRLLGLTVTVCLLAGWTACQSEAEPKISDARIKALAEKSLPTLLEIEQELGELEDARSQISQQLVQLTASREKLEEQVRTLRENLQLPPAGEVKEEQRNFPLALNVGLIVIVLLAAAIFWKIKSNRQREAEEAEPKRRPAAEAKAGE